jgi:membrane protease YdiL (CAAX protease family)
VSASDPPSAKRALWLIVRLAAQRWLARVAAGGWRRGKLKRKSGMRRATPRKAGAGWMLALLGGLMLFPSSLLQGWMLIERVVTANSPLQAVPTEVYFQAIMRLDNDHVTDPQKIRSLIADHATDAPAAEVDAWAQLYEKSGSSAFRSEWSDVDWPAGAASAPVRNTIALLLLYVAVMTLMMSIGASGRELGTSQWDMEWLWSLPVPARALFVSRLLEHALLNVWVWFTVPAISLAAFRVSGYGWLPASVLALASSAGIAILIGAVHLLIETWIRTRAVQFKNVQALCSVAGLVMFFGLFALIPAPRLPNFIVGAGQAFPAAWNPFSLPAQFTAGDPARAALAGALFLAWIWALPTAAIGLCGRMVRSGLYAKSNVRTGKRGSPAVSYASARSGFLHGAMGKDLRLVLRDRNLLVQTLLMPVLIVGFQLVMNRDLTAAIASDVASLSAFALSVCCYLYAFCAMQVISVEGKALWQLYTFPQPLEKILKGKVWMWAAISACYGLAIIGGGFALGVRPDLAGAVRLLLVLAVVPVYAFIAAGLGAMATDPLEQEPRRRIGTGTVYLYFLITAALGYPLAKGSLWQVFVQCAFAALLALALWQKLRDRLPYLLDPVERPPARIGVGDGLIAAMAFLSLQMLIAVIAIASGASEETAILIAFPLSGLLVTLTVLYFLLRAKTELVFETLGMQRRAGVDSSSASAGAAVGLAAGLGVGVLGLVWMWLLNNVPLLQSWHEDVDVLPAAEMLGLLIPLGIVAAPIFEEFIFRGLLFRGLERSLGSGRAIFASAAIFALVHPAISVPAVFLLGLTAAWIFRRQGLLIAPIMTHATYNAVVILVPTLWPELLS